MAVSVLHSQASVPQVLDKLSLLLCALGSHRRHTRHLEQAFTVDSSVPDSTKTAEVSREKLMRLAHKMAMPMAEQTLMAEAYLYDHCTVKYAELH
jgi:hypothetical protein